MIDRQKVRRTNPTMFSDCEVTQIRSSRRDLLFAAPGAIAAAMVSGSSSARAAAPIARLAGSHMKLSLAAYSFDRYLIKRGTPEQVAAAKMTIEQFIDYCAEINLDGTELTSYYFPIDIPPEYLASLKERCFRLGLDISGTAIGNDFCLPEGPKRNQNLMMCREWIDHAAMLGAPVIRIFAGSVPAGDSEEAARERCVAGINESLDYASQRGIFLALENHGGITSTSEQILKIIEGVKASPWFGVNLDGGNFKTPDPYFDLERIAPYTINAQLKATVFPNGIAEKADLQRVIAILKRANYRGYVVLEYEDQEDPRTAIPTLIQKMRDAIHSQES